MLWVLVVILAVTGALVVNHMRWGPGLSIARRTLIGALLGAGAGLLVLPALGLVAAVLVFVLALAATAAVVVAAVLLIRHLMGPRF